MAILIKNAEILTGDMAEPYIKGCSIEIEDNIIKRIYSKEKIADKSDFDRILDGKNKIVMPGLVNAHTHSPMTIFRNFADDLPLEEWLFNRIIPCEGRLTKEDQYWGSMLAIMEMIQSGTTCFADMYMDMEEVARAVAETGIRACISKGPITSGVRGKGLMVDLQGTSEYVKRWHNCCNGRIKVFIEIHSVYLFDEESIRGAAKLAEDIGTGIHIHLSETENEVRTSIEKYGVNPIEAASKFGIFNVPTIAAHCVHISERDMEIIKAGNVFPVHNPSSNLKLGSGIAPVQRMISRGIDVCIGTDGAASNNNLNMFEEIHLAALLHKGINKDPTALNAEQVLKMATVNGAKALGFGGETGILKEGMKADLIIIDTDKPHLCPINNPVSAAVYSVQASDVSTVICDGNILMENRQFKTMDEEKIKFMVNKASERIMGN